MKSDLRLSIENLLELNPSSDEELILNLKILLNNTDSDKGPPAQTVNFASVMENNLRKLLSRDVVYEYIPSGFPSFDAEYGGLTPGELIVVGARPAMGKTLFLINVALNSSKHQPVLFFTCDLTLNSLSNRFLATLSGYSYSAVTRKLLSEHDKLKIADLPDAFKSHQLFFNESNAISIQDLRLKCEEAVKENQVKLIIIDYLQLLCKSMNRYTRVMEIGYSCQELRSIAKELNVCILVSSQLSRSVEYRGGSKVPILTDLRESGAIEQEADKVMFLYRPEYYNIVEDELGNSTFGMVELHIAKNRLGPLGVVNLKRDAAFTRFYEFDSYKNEFAISDDRLSELNDLNF